MISNECTSVCLLYIQTLLYVSAPLGPLFSNSSDYLRKIINNGTVFQIFKDFKPEYDRIMLQIFTDFKTEHDGIMLQYLQTSRQNMMG